MMRDAKSVAQRSAAAANINAIRSVASITITCARCRARTACPVENTNATKRATKADVSHAFAHRLTNYIANAVRM